MVKQHKQHKRRPRRSPSRRRAAPPTDDPEDLIVGYVARIGFTVICWRNSCILAGSREKMLRGLARDPHRDLRRIVIEPARLNHVLRCLRVGGIYSFDEEAYTRLRPHAIACGMHLQRVTFTSEDQLILIQWQPLPPGPVQVVPDWYDGPWPTNAP